MATRLLIILLLIFRLSFANDDIRFYLNKIVEDLTKGEDAKIAISVQSLNKDKVYFQYKSNDPFIPASNQKIITTISALINLTPEYKFKTLVATDGSIKDGILNGNLYLIGGGDPTFSDNDLEDIVKNLKQLGIKKIKGNIVGDNSFFSEEGVGQGWPEKDLNYCFTAPFSGLSINENCLRLNIEADKKRIYISINPRSKYYKIINNLKISSKKNEVFLKVNGNIIIVNGYIKPYTKKEFSLPLEHPSLFTTSVFYNTLPRNGIEISGNYIVSKAPKNIKVLYLHQSEPLREIIKKTNKDSDNFYAEQVFRTLGKEILNEGSTSASSKVVLETLKKIGIDVENIKIYDGSGLSKYNQLTAESLVKLLTYTYKTPYFYDVYDSLAISGKDGTLKRRLNDELLRGKVVAKTGFIKGVKNLTGFVTTINGDVFVFSILTNDLKSTKVANSLQEEICKFLVTYPQKLAFKEQSKRF